VSAEHLLGHSAPDYLKASWQQHLLRLRQISSESVGFNDEINGHSVYCTIYVSGEYICVEIEPVTGTLSSTFLSELQAHQEQIRCSDSLDKTLNELTKSIAEITGFERVMVYKFDEEWNGQVIAELCKQSTIRSYLHQRFPASDIPKQVRELYSKNPIRSIVGSAEQPADIIAHKAGEPLDLTKGVLRAVSPIHMTYMQNIKTTINKTYFFTI
jgi:light-regulated signal transduction histidine kinase (bacteriophytochrome)